MRLVAIDVGESKIQFRVHAAGCRAIQHEECDGSNIIIFDADTSAEVITRLWADRSEHLAVSTHDSSHYAATRFLGCTAHRPSALPDEMQS